MDGLVKVVGIIQARITSSRLPCKVMLDLCGKSLLERVIEQAKKSQVLQEVYVATSVNQEDDLIEHVAQRSMTKCYRGSLNNVFQRFREGIDISDADIVVRITADNPLTNQELIDYGVKYLLVHELDYVGFRNVPVGTAVEVFTAKSFKTIPQGMLNEHNIEHVTSYYYQNPSVFKIDFVEEYYREDLSGISLTVDTLEDYTKVFNLFSLNKQNDLEFIINNYENL